MSCGDLTDPHRARLGMLGMGEHLPTTGDIFKKMLPVVGKCSKNVSSLRQMLNFQCILSICLKLLTFSELSVDCGKCSSFICGRAFT